MIMRTLIIALFYANIAIADQPGKLWPESTSTSSRDVASVASLVDGLANRLHENPDDAGGWLLLAKSYQHLDRADDARLAYRRAKALGKTDDAIEQWLATQPGQDAWQTVRDWLGETR